MMKKYLLNWLVRNMFKKAEVHNIEGNTVIKLDAKTLSELPNLLKKEYSQAPQITSVTLKKVADGLEISISQKNG